MTQQSLEQSATPMCILVLRNEGKVGATQKYGVPPQAGCFKKNLISFDCVFESVASLWKIKNLELADFFWENFQGLSTA